MASNWQEGHEEETPALTAWPELRLAEGFLSVLGLICNKKKKDHLKKTWRHKENPPLKNRSRNDKNHPPFNRSKSGFRGSPTRLTKETKVIISIINNEYKERITRDITSSLCRNRKDKKEDLQVT